MSELLYKDLGQVDYLAALEFQERLVALKQRELFPDVLLFVEHPHVYTLGRGGNEASGLFAYRSTGTGLTVNRSRSSDRVRGFINSSSTFHHDDLR